MPELNPGPGYSKLYVGDTQVFPSGGGGGGWVDLADESLIEVDYTGIQLVGNSFPPEANIRVSQHGVDGITVAWDAFEQDVQWSGGGLLLPPTYLTPPPTKCSAVIPIRLKKEFAHDRRSYAMFNVGYTSAGLQSLSNMTVTAKCDTHPGITLSKVQIANYLELGVAELELQHLAPEVNILSFAQTTEILAILNADNPRFEMEIIQAPLSSAEEIPPAGTEFTFTPFLNKPTVISGPAMPPGVRPAAGTQTSRVRYEAGSYTIPSLYLKELAPVSIPPIVNLLPSTLSIQWLQYWRPGENMEASEGTSGEGYIQTDPLLDGDVYYDVYTPIKNSTQYSYLGCIACEGLMMPGSLMPATPFDTAIGVKLYQAVPGGDPVFLEEHVFDIPTAPSNELYYGHGSFTSPASGELLAKFFYRLKALTDPAAALMWFAIFAGLNEGPPTPFHDMVSL
jgi:hypothetical protein